MHRSPKALLEQHWNLRCRDRDQNIDKQRPYRKARQEAEDQQEAACDFGDAHEWSRELGKRDTDLLKSARAECSGKKELLDAFGQEDPTN